MFLDTEWRPEGEPQEPGKPAPSMTKMAIVLVMVPTCIFFGVVGFFAIKAGRDLVGCSSLGAAVISLQVFVRHGFDVVYSVLSKLK